MKATGLGLSLPLNQFAVTVHPSRLLFAPAEWCPPQSWHFHLLKPSPVHQMAAVTWAEIGTQMEFNACEVSAHTLMPQPHASGC